jgi:hypothetical protein
VWAPDEGGAPARRPLGTALVADWAHPLARSSSFYRQLGDTARHEDAPLAVAIQMMDFSIRIPFQVSANVIGRASIRGTVDIRSAEGAAQANRRARG